MAYTMTPEELRKFTEDGGEMTPHLKYTMEQMSDRATIDSYTREIDCFEALPLQERKKHPWWCYLK